MVFARKNSSFSKFAKRNFGFVDIFVYITKLRMSACRRARHFKTKCKQNSLSFKKLWFEKWRKNKSKFLKNFSWKRVWKRQFDNSPLCYKVRKGIFLPFLTQISLVKSQFWKHCSQSCLINTVLLKSVCQERVLQHIIWLRDYDDC